MYMGRDTCPLLWAAALGAAQPCGLSLTTRGIAPASLRYDRLTLVARVAGPLCLAGDPLLDCVPARLSTVASMAPGDVCHGPRCSLAGLGPAAMGYLPCCWPGGSADSPQCARRMGCWFFPVPRPPYVCTSVPCPGPPGSCSQVCPLGALLCLCGVRGHLAPVHRCARSVRCFACAVSWATWLLFTGVPARCVACVCGVLGHLAPVHRCVRSLRCFACAVSLATWLLFTGVPAWCVVLLVRCPAPLGSCSPLCPLGALFCLCGVLGHLAPVHRCARSACCVACAVSWAAWLLFTGVFAWCVSLRVRCPGPLGSCSSVCPLGVLRVCAVSWATWLLFTGVPTRRVVLRVRCPGPLGSCSPVCLLGVLCCVCGVLGDLAPVHLCARSVRCFACAVSWGTWLLFTGVPARCVVCVCGVLDHLLPVHRGAISLCSFACAVSWATWLLFTGVPARCVALRVRCPGPLGSCSLVCPRGLLCCVCGVLGHLAPVHRCACSVCCVACAVSWATWLLFPAMLARRVVLLLRCPGLLGCCSPVCPLGALPVFAVSWAAWLLFTGVPAWCVVLLVPYPRPLGPCSPVCPLGVLCCVCGVLGHLAPVHWCARSVCCVACAVSGAPWLLFTGALARYAVRCPGPLGSCPPVCSLGVLCCGLRVRGITTGCSLVHPDSGYLWPAGAGYPPGAHSSIRTAALRSRQGLRLLQARTRPSGRRLFRSRQGLGSLPGAHTTDWTAAGVAWHLSLCRGSLRVVRALRVCGIRLPSLLGTCPCALVVAGRVPLWRSSWPRVVRRASSGPVALGAPVGFPDAVVPFLTPWALSYSL